MPTYRITSTAYQSRLRGRHKFCFNFLPALHTRLRSCEECRDGWRQPTVPLFSYKEFAASSELSKRGIFKQGKRTKTKRGGSQISSRGSTYAISAQGRRGACLCFFVRPRRLGGILLSSRSRHAQKASSKRAVRLRYHRVARIHRARGSAVSLRGEL